MGVKPSSPLSMWLELLLGVVLLFAWLYRYVTKQFGEFAKRGMPFAQPSFPFGSSNAKKLFSGKLSFFDLEKDLAQSDEFKSEKVFGYFMMGQPTVVINDEELAKLVMKVGLAHLLRKQRLVACEKTNMGKLEIDPNGIFVIKGGVWFRSEKRI